MEILSISKIKNESVIRLNSSELVALCNLLYRATKDDSAKEIDYRMYDTLMFARDLSQYGHIDKFCLDNIVKCREKVRSLKK